MHHANNISYPDKNHVGILIICDRIFSMFREEDGKPVFGIRKPFASFNLFCIAFE